MTDISGRGVRGCYLAGPIDAVTLEEARDWQDELAAMCPDILFFSPAHPYRNAVLENADKLDELNRAAIDIMQCVCAYLPPDRMAFGTIREVEYSVAQGYPTIVVAPRLSSLLRYDLTHVSNLSIAASVLNRWAS